MIQTKIVKYRRNFYATWKVVQEDFKTRNEAKKCEKKLKESDHERNKLAYGKSY